MTQDPLATAPNTEWIDLIEPPERLIILAGRQMQEMMTRVLRPHSLKLVEWRLLRCIKTETNHTIWELSELVVVDRTVASRLVDKLADRGLLVKNALKTDRRVAQISLSDEGRALIDKAEPDVKAARQKLFRNMSPDEARDLNRLLMQFITNTGTSRV